jgi:hypothetical protein
MIVKLEQTHPVHTKLLHHNGIGAGGDSAIICRRIYRFPIDQLFCLHWHKYKCRNNYPNIFLCILP